MAANKFYSEYTGPTNFPGTDCTPPVFPDPSFADCPEAYALHEGEIDTLWITNVVQDATTKQWEGVVIPADHTDSGAGGLGATGIEMLIGFGDKPLAEAITAPLPVRAGRVITTDRRHTVNFSYTDLTAANYTLGRALQGTGWLCFWYKTLDGNVFGGATGIIARVANAGHVHQRGENVPMEGQITLEWYHLFDPPMDELDPPAPLTMGKMKAPEPLKGKAAKEENLATT